MPFTITTTTAAAITILLEMCPKKERRKTFTSLWRVEQDTGRPWTVFFPSFFQRLSFSFKKRDFVMTRCDAQRIDIDGLYHLIN